MIKVLLTGAGFTHQYGAPLTRKLWELIHNDPQVQKSSYIKSVLLENINNFESAYSSIMGNQNTSDNNKKVISTATTYAYEIIDKFCCEPTNKVDALKEFIFEFIYRDHKNKSMIFTLNQDLFIERQLYTLIEKNENGSHKQKLAELGIEMCEAIWIERMGISSSNIIKQFQPLEKSWRIQPNQATIQSIHHDFDKWEKGPNTSCPYIKLHGSHDLYSNDHEPLMIIGRNKDKQLKDFQILNEYYKIFKTILASNQCKIVIIGYSFSDDHINEILCESTKQMKSELHIVSTFPFDELVTLLEKSKIDTKQICGAYSDGLTDSNIKLLIKNYCLRGTD